MSKYCISCGAANANAANVCTNCGKALNDNSIINGNKSVLSNNSDGRGNGWQPNFEQTKEISGIYLKRLFFTLVSVLKEPVKSGRKYVTCGERNLLIGFLVMQAVLSAVFTLIPANEINSVIEKYEEISISIPKVFLITAIGSMAVSFAIAGLIYLIATLFKEKMSFRKALHIIAVRSVGVDIILALSIIVAYFNPFYGMVIFALSWLGGLAFMIPVIRSENVYNVDRTPYIAIIVTFLSFVVFCVWIRVSIPMYVPSELKETVKETLDMLNKLKDVDLGSLRSLWW